MQKIPLKIASIYALIGALWILLSDRALKLLVTDESLYAEFSTFKGWFFVAVTAALLYRLVARDHREMERSRETLREREELLTNVLATMPVGVWLLDRDGNIDYGNPAGQRIWCGARFVGMEQFGAYKGWWLATGEPVGAEEWGAARAIRNGETSLDEEIEIEGFDGVRRIIRHSAVPLRNIRQEIVGALVVNEEITAAKLAEAERERLKEERDRLIERLQLQFERMPIGCIIVDRENRVVDWNPAAGAIFAFARDEVLGKDLMELIVPPHVRAFADGVAARLRGGEMTANATNENLTGDGRRIICEWYNTPLQDREGEVTHILSMVQDVTERKRGEREIVAYQEELRFLASEISLIEERERRRIAVELHDKIGQALALARIRLGALKATDSPDLRRLEETEIQGLLEQAIAASRSVTFDLSPPILYELGFEAAVQSLCERFRHEYRISIEFATDGRPKPLSDDARVFLFQAVRELLVNIIKHAGARTAWVSSLRENGTIRIMVEDDGHGFDMAAVGIRSGGSRGFGLFSIRERLACLGGSFTAEPAPGQGTRVTLTAPLAKGPDAGEEGE